MQRVSRVWPTLCLCVAPMVWAEDCPLVTDAVVQDMLDDADWVIAGEVSRIEKTTDPAWRTAQLEVQELIKVTTEDIDRADFRVKFQRKSKTPLKRGQSYLLYVFETPKERIVGACNSVLIGKRPRPNSDFLKHMFALSKIQRVPVADQVREATALVFAAKDGVAKYFKEHGFLPTDNADLGWEASPHAYNGKYVSSIQINYGTVVVQFGRNADKEIFGEYLTYIPYEKIEDDSTRIVWKCGTAEAGRDLSLAGSSVGIPTAVVETTIKTIYLPGDCTKEAGESASVGGEVGAETTDDGENVGADGVTGG